MTRWLSYVLLALSILPGSASAHTVMIHAVGLDPDLKEYNYFALLNETAAFLKACDQSHIDPKDCHIFGSLDVVSLGADGKDQTLRNFLKLKGIDPSRVRSQFKKEEILNQLKESLERAQPGDQVVFSLDDHGSPGVKAYSCVYLTRNIFDKICETDVKEILDRYKKKGVKVFVSAQACFAGAFSSLSSQEVCTYVESNQFKVSLSNSSWESPIGIWAQFNQVKTEKPLSLSQLRKSTFSSQTFLEGGGFGSDLIHQKICSQNQPHFLSTDKEARATYSSLREGASPVVRNFSKLNEVANSCSRTQPKDLLNLEMFLEVWRVADSLSSAIQPDSETLARFQAKNCQKKNLESSDGAKYRGFCETWEKYKGTVDQLKEIYRDLDLAFKVYFKKVRSLEQKDQELLVSSGSDDLEVQQKRGELLKTLEGLEAEIAQKTQKILSGKPVFESVLEDLWNSLCIEIPLAESSSERLYHVVNTLVKLPSTRTSLIKDRTPSQRSDLEKAKACEDSFVF